MRRRLPSIQRAAAVGVAALLGASASCGDGGNGGADPWSTLAALPIAVADAAAEVVEDTVLLVGGESGSAELPVQAYSPTADTWAVRRPMPVAHLHAAAASMNGRIYLFGHAALGGDSARVSEYDPAADAWTPRAPMPVGRFLAAAAAVGGRIYVIAGVVNGRAGAVESDLVSEYDPGADAWVAKQPMPTARHGAAVSVLSGRIYVLGGTTLYDPATPLQTVEAYDPATDTWTSRKPMPIGRDGAVAGSVGGRIYVAGGGNVGSLRATHAYDPERDTWEGKMPMPSWRDEPAAAVYADRLIVFGGATDAGPSHDVEAYDPGRDRESLE
jgi:N-acetylneuraminic acid mutarotase